MLFYHNDSSFGSTRDGTKISNTKKSEQDCPLLEKERKRKTLSFLSFKQNEIRYIKTKNMNKK